MKTAATTILVVLILKEAYQLKRWISCSACKVAMKLFDSYGAMIIRVLLKVMVSGVSLCQYLEQLRTEYVWYS